MRNDLLLIAGNSPFVIVALVSRCFVGKASCRFSRNNEASAAVHDLGRIHRLFCRDRISPGFFYYTMPSRRARAGGWPRVGFVRPGR